MEAQVSEQIGTKRYERSEVRQTHCNGYWSRFWETRVGDIPQRIPKVWRGSYPGFLKPRRRAGKALMAIIQTAYVRGVVSTQMVVGGATTTAPSGTSLSSPATNWPPLS
jgi:transposase-like protein